ncbi:MAG: carboxymuconolactone decarboxylase family protein [Desulfosudaceae bacterium]
MTDQQPRIPPATASELDPETVKLMGIIGRQHDGQPDNIFATLARHPDLLKSFLPLGSHILMNSTLPPRDREILILRVAWLCHSEYEWGQHLVIAGQAGLSGEEISRIRLGAEAPGWSELESLLIQAVDELHSSTVISEETWQALAGFYDTRQLMDLVFTVGQYHLVAMALRSFGVLLDQRLTGFEAETLSS